MITAEFIAGHRAFYEGVEFSYNQSRGWRDGWLEAQWCKTGIDQRIISL
jgi:hypothetical protein